MLVKSLGLESDPSWVTRSCRVCMFCVGNVVSPSQGYGEDAVYVWSPQHRAGLWTALIMGCM